MAELGFERQGSLDADGRGLNHSAMVHLSFPVGTRSNQKPRQGWPLVTHSQLRLRKQFFFLPPCHSQFKELR